MIISEQKPFDEILRMMEGENNVFIVGCNGCAESSGTGGRAQVAEMNAKLEEAGKTVTGTVSIDLLCDKALVKTRLARREDQIKAADSLLVMTCGIGVQATSAVVNRVCQRSREEPCRCSWLGLAVACWISIAG